MHKDYIVVILDKHRELGICEIELGDGLKKVNVL